MPWNASSDLQIGRGMSGRWSATFDGLGICFILLQIRFHKQEFGGGEDGDGQTVYVYDASRELNDLGVLVMRQDQHLWIYNQC